MTPTTLTSKPLILVVDDHQDTCELLVRMLRLKGYGAICIEGGANALSFLSDHRPGLVFLDLMMPDLNGFDVLRVMRADPSLAGIPVVVFSSLDDGPAREAARELGARDYVVKGQMAYAQLAGVVERNLAEVH